jgi:hypothetical protein
LEIKDLQDTHYLSKGIYRKLRDSGWKNPNPWKITKKEAVQTSKQQTAYLLCRECEQRFSKYGERWVMGHCLQADGKFPLLSILASRIPDLSPDNSATKVYYAANIPEIDISALAYFAVSIFWRASICPWNADGSIPVELGPFKEQFRQYLLDAKLQAFPRNCSLLLAVREGKEVSHLMIPPTSARRDNFRVHKFPMPGLAFALAVGKNLPANHREMCFVHGAGNPIGVTPIIEPILENEVLKLFNRIPAEKKRLPH